MSYHEKLKDPRWQRLRLEAMQRDNFACRDCGDAEKQLTVHHCFYEKGGPWATPLNLLLTVCMECHGVRQALEHDIHLAISKICSSFDKGSLEGFAKSSVSVASKEDSQPDVVCLMDAEFETDMRWYLFALENPKFRKMYESVTGNNPKWKAK